MNAKAYYREVLVVLLIAVEEGCLLLLILKQRRKPVFCPSWRAAHFGHHPPLVSQPSYGFVTDSFR
jgi:hypothetical protein